MLLYENLLVVSWRVKDNLFLIYVCILDDLVIDYINIVLTVLVIFFFFFFQSKEVY